MFFCRSEIDIFRHSKHEILETKDMKQPQRLNLANIKPQGVKEQLWLQIRRLKSFWAARNKSHGRQQPLEPTVFGLSLNLLVRTCSCPHMIYKISQNWHYIQHILLKNNILYADQNTNKRAKYRRNIIVFLLSLCQVEAQHCVWYGECGESQKVPGKKYNCNYTGPAVPLPSEGSDLLTVQTSLFLQIFDVQNNDL